MEGGSPPCACRPQGYAARARHRHDCKPQGAARRPWSQEAAAAGAGPGGNAGTRRHPCSPRQQQQASPPSLHAPPAYAHGAAPKPNLTRANPSFLPGRWRGCQIKRRASLRARAPPPPPTSRAPRPPPTTPRTPGSLRSVGSGRSGHSMGGMGGMQHEKRVVGAARWAVRCDARFKRQLCRQFSEQAGKRQRLGTSATAA